MTATRSGLMDLLRLVPSGGPAILNASVTNLCNATCDFCNFAHNKGFVTDRRSMDATRFHDSLAHMREQANVRFVTFMGGEPLLHPKIAEMAHSASAMGVQPTLVTNGWLLPGALAVQEGAIIAAGALVGVPPATALAAALVRRSREVLFSVPGLIAWQRAEIHATSGAILKDTP